MVKVHLPRSVLDTAIGAWACLGIANHLFDPLLTLRFSAKVVVFIIAIVIATVFPPARDAIGTVDYAIRISFFDVELIHRFVLATNRTSARIHASSFLE